MTKLTTKAGAAMQISMTEKNRPASTAFLQSLVIARTHKGTTKSQPNITKALSIQGGIRAR